jgi:hypothetical protein
VSEIIKDNTTLNVCSSNTRSIKVFERQPYGEFIANNTRGVELDTDDFINKATNFIKKAKEKCAEQRLFTDTDTPYCLFANIANLIFNACKKLTI